MQRDTISLIPTAPTRFVVILPHDTLEIEATYIVSPPLTSGSIGILNGKLKDVEIHPKDGGVFDLVDVDVTKMLLEFLRHESLESLQWFNYNNLELEWNQRPQIHQRPHYCFDTICEALKNHAALTALQLDGIQPIHKDGLEGVYKQFADIADQVSLETVHLTDIANQFLLSTEVFCLQGAGRASGFRYKWWAKTMLELNLNKMGRKNLRADTSISDFFAMIQPNKVRPFVSLHSDFMETILLRNQLDSLDYSVYKDEEFNYFLAQDESIFALDNNYAYLKLFIDQWLPVAYHDVRVTNLLYGMLRESPNIWCQQPIGTYSPSKKKRKVAEIQM
jgi:hypothetical protein